MNKKIRLSIIFSILFISAHAQDLSGFWGDCDEAWDSYMNQIIYDIVEEDE